MRKVVTVAALAGLAVGLSGCAHRGLGRTGPDEYAVVRNQPLVVPPDFSLVAPQPGVTGPQGNSPSAQALDALFGGPAPRSPGETTTLDNAGTSDLGVRSNAGDPDTKIVDKGATTRDIVAAPEGDGADAKVAVN